MTIFLISEPSTMGPYSYLSYPTSSYSHYHPHYHQQHSHHNYSQNHHWLHCHPMVVDSFKPYNWIDHHLQPKRRSSDANTSMPRLRRSADSTTSGRTDPVHVRWRRLGRTSVDHVPQQRPNSVETYRSSPAPSLDSDPATEQQEQPIQVEAPQHIVRYVPKRFEVDCSDFRPENVRVQVIDNRLVVEARQEQINDSGYVCMELAREFNLTDRFDLANITCRLTADGQLHIEVPCAITRPNEAIESSETETLVPDSSEASVELERITDAGQSEQLNLNPTETDTVSEPAEEQSSINVATETESESISETTHNLESATESQRIVEEEPQPQSCTESSVQSGAN